MILQRFDDTNLEDRSYQNRDNSNLESYSHQHRGMFIRDLIVYPRLIYILRLNNKIYV